MPATDTSAHYFFEAKPRMVGKVGSGGVASDSDTTIPHTFVGLTNGNAYVVVANRTDSTGTTKNQLSDTETFIGKVSGTNFIDCVREVEGTAQAWAVDIVLEVLHTATGWNKLVEGIEIEHNEDGTHKAFNPTIPTTGSIKDANGNELIKFPSAVASAVNEITVTNAATGNDVSVAATGGDTNINLQFVPKGTGALTVPAGTYEANVTDDDDIPNKKYVDDRSNTDGWIASADTWTYASATTFTIAGVDRTTIFTKGTRLKLTQTSAKYFVVVSSAFSTNTTVTVTGGTDYTLANAAITSPYYSYAANPQGYPSSFAYTTTYTGFSADPTTVCRFSVVGTTCLVQLESSGDGTSNATGLTFTLPIAAARSHLFAAFCAAKDGGSNSSTPGHLATTAGSTTVTAYKSWYAGAWTNSSSKNIYLGNFIYEI